MSRQQPRPDSKTEPRPRRPAKDRRPTPRPDERTLPGMDRDPASRAHTNSQPRSRRRPGPEPRPRPGPEARRRPGAEPAGHDRSSRRSVLQPRPVPVSNQTNRSKALRAARQRVLVVLAWATAATLALGRRVLAAITGEVGRRLAQAVGLTVVLAVVVTALYDRGEVPTAAAQQAVQAPSGGSQGGSAARGGASARRKDPATLGGLRGRDRVARAGEKPAAVAAAWYAARHGVPRAKVKPLQQDRLSAKEVRVLVLADHGHGRLRTALVRLRHGADGWSVR